MRRFHCRSSIAKKLTRKQEEAKVKLIDKSEKRGRTQSGEEVIQTMVKVRSVRVLIVIKMDKVTFSPKIHAVFSKRSLLNYLIYIWTPFHIIALKV